MGHTQHQFVKVPHLTHYTTQTIHFSTFNEGSHYVMTKNFVELTVRYNLARTTVEQTTKVRRTDIKISFKTTKVCPDVPKPNYKKIECVNL